MLFLYKVSVECERNDKFDFDTRLAKTFDSVTLILTL